MLIFNANPTVVAQQPITLILAWRDNGFISERIAHSAIGLKVDAVLSKSCVTRSTSH